MDNAERKKILNLINTSVTPTTELSMEADEKAENAQENALEAITLAEGVNEHFWYDSTGAHITEDTQEDYQQDPSSAGGNTLITSQGMAIRQGTTQLAAFTGSGIQIGQTNEAHTIIAADATEWYTGALTKAGDVEYGETVKTVVLDSVVLSFSDDVFASYVATVTDTAPKTYKITTSGTLTYNSEDPDNIGDFALEETVEFTSLNYNSQGNYYIKTFVFPVVLSSGYTQNYYIIARGTSETDITRVYAGFQYYTQVQTQDIKFKYACNLTIESGDTIHGPRVTFGEADPDDKIAAATNIHNKLRIGDYGEIDASNEYMLIAGNGTDDNNRSNALTVDWQGRVELGNYSGTLTSIFDLFYPVGSYYETSDTTFDPNTEWGGTWSLETEGQVHVSAGTNYTVAGALTDTTDGGTKTVTLTAAQSGVPAHSHPVPSNVNYDSSYNTNAGARTSGYRWGTSVSKSTSNNTAQNATQAHNNMQPYIIVNRWHRTA